MHLRIDSGRGFLLFVTTEGEHKPAASSDRHRGSGFGLGMLDELRLGSAWVGIGVFIAYLILWLGIQNLIGILDGFRIARALPLNAGSLGEPIWTSPFGGWEAVNALLISYLFAAALYARRGALRDLSELRPTLRLSDAEFQAQLADMSAGQAMRVLTVGTGVGLAISFFDAGIWGGFDRPSISEPYFAVVCLRMALVGVLFALLAEQEVNFAGRFFRLGRSHLEVDLSNLRPLAPFGRKGQRSVIIWMLALAIFSLFFLGPAPGWTNLGTVSFGLIIAGVGFLLPVLGVRRSIIAAKERDLDRLGREIRHEHARLFPTEQAGPDPDTTPGTGMDARLANLVTYKTMIESAREWPFGASTLARIAFFMAIGVGSWVGGAVVERLLSSALE